MFKSSYIPSKVTKSWRDFVHDENSLLKNANLVYIDDEGKMHFMEGFPPEHALGEGDDPDHPALAYNPLTGELIDGYHPIDAIAKDMLERAHANGRTDIGMPYIKSVINTIFKHHNNKHPEGSHHVLNNFDHPSWRKNVVGEYPEQGQLDASKHQVRGRRGADGSLGMKQNYSYKFGTPDVAGADRGQSIDSGLWVPYESTGTILDAINKQHFAAGLPAPFPDFEDYYYTKSAKVPISELTNGRVVALGRNEQVALMGGTMHPNVRNRLGLPAAMEGSVRHKDLHPSRMLRMMPDWMFVPTARGRSGGEDTSTKMTNALEREGVQHDISDPVVLSTLWKTPAIQANFHRAGTTGGRYKSGMKRMFEHFGITPGDDSHHDRSRRRMGGTNRSDVGQGVRGAELATLYRGLVGKLMAEGQPEGEAIKSAEEMIRNYKDPRLDSKYTPDHRAIAEPLITGLRDAKGWTPFDLSETGIDTSDPEPVFQNAPVTSQVPDHMQSRILTSANLAPPGTEPHPPAEPVAPAPPQPTFQLPIRGREPLPSPAPPSMMPSAAAPAVPPPQMLSATPQPQAQTEIPPPQMMTPEMFDWEGALRRKMLQKAPVEMQFDITGKPVYVVGGPGGHRAPLTGLGKVGGAIGRTLGALGGLAAGGRSLGQLASNVYFGGQQAGRVGEGIGQGLSSRQSKARAAEAENVHMAFARAQAQGLIPMGMSGTPDQKRQILGQLSATQSRQNEAAKAARLQSAREAKERHDASVRGTKIDERLIEQQRRLEAKLAYERKLREERILDAQRKARAAAAGAQVGQRTAAMPRPPTMAKPGDLNADGVPDLAQGAMAMPPLTVPTAAQEIANSQNIPPEDSDHQREGIADDLGVDLPAIGGNQIDADAINAELRARIDEAIRGGRR